MAETAIVGAVDVTPGVAARAHGLLAAAAAHNGDPVAADRAADRAVELSAASIPAQEPPWFYWWSQSRVLYLTGVSAMGAGRFDLAEARLAECVASMGPEFVADRAFHLTHLAAARLRLGELEGACRTATDAVDLIRGLDAERARTQLVAFRRSLEPHATASAVTTFAAATADVLPRNSG